MISAAVAAALELNSYRGPATVAKLHVGTPSTCLVICCRMKSLRVIHPHGLVLSVSRTHTQQ
jgi:hypothetical protein